LYARASLFQFYAFRFSRIDWAKPTQGSIGGLTLKYILIIVAGFILSSRIVRAGPAHLIDQERKQAVIAIDLGLKLTIFCKKTLF
jgi:hypothetical protein